MPSASALQDPEGQHPARPSRACTAPFWLLSLALLLVSGAFAAYVSWSLLRTSDSPGPTTLEAPKPLPGPGARFSEPPQGLFAQVVAQDAQLSTGALSWHSTPGLAGVALAPGVRYDAAARELVVAQAGVYFVFVNLSLRRVVAGPGHEGRVAAALHLQPPVPGAAALAFTVDLPPLPAAEDTADTASGFRGALLPLSAGQRLSVHLKPSEESSPTWQLDQGTTLLGLFCVTLDKTEGNNLPQSM